VAAPLTPPNPTAIDMFRLKNNPLGRKTVDVAVVIVAFDVMFSTSLVTGVVDTRGVRDVNDVLVKVEMFEVKWSRLPVGRDLRESWGLR